ncbi:MAG: protease complex subunit PrcB family protein [candidate division Zixibacteria bacterium]|nr:protease complex subunit PrcB family protein [candidate division Zixibacteria bacterium]NIR63201.1 protease complex subunit PrcB family protein [candidate division Zixibacteria bacterium]NIS16899.1 protease complex subunit PrcB family protein [candidate division Zixibacteria bacterium]NIS45178.1 protease complex subunit PrcB family protein [candidate division Zixibacteria bacterium]NIT51751.1 protease complex subunit PrcB family protein [candidate division Zixibacteria bacterium]
MHKAFILILIGSLFFMACQGDDSNAGEAAEKTPEETDETQTLYYELLASGAQSGIAEPIDIIIDSQEELDSIWQRHYSYLSVNPEPPDIDFDEDIVVGVFRGEQPTTGYWVRLDSVYIQGDEQVVAVTANAGPSEDRAVLQVLTQPFFLAAVAKTDKDIKLDFTIEE